MSRTAAVLAVLAFVLFGTGCQLFPQRAGDVSSASAAPPPPVVEHPIASHRFEFDPESDDVIGRVQVTYTRATDTLPDIARRFNLGYEEIVRANPGVDPWLPGEGTELILPTRWVLPDAPRSGVVINLAAMRLFYFLPREHEDGPQTVITHPIGIGRVGWSTPEGETRITAKARDPWWFPPASVRREHAKQGDPLPSKVPPGVDNPLGAHVLKLGWPSYLIHGTNKPYGVGMRVSSGCIRLYPEDIAELYPQLAVGVDVRVVNQPFVYGWQGGALYVQSYQVLEDDEREQADGAGIVLNAAISNDLWQRVKQHNAGLDLELLGQVIEAAQGIAVPVTRKGLTLDRYLATVPRVHNVLPDGSNWNGDDRLLANAREWEAMRQDDRDAAVATP
ncbi:MAG TPA: L,D-transpeptidase family protein [Steroidobacteraceae bacterium]|nr:L,D-transpeptidase family protein [Steroidobacteraceae bacterium]